MIKVCHMTSAHGQEDIRIFLKECVSLAAAGYDTYQVSRGRSYEKNGVHLVGVGEISGNRLIRMLKGAQSVYRAAREIDADIYHFHDPELLPYGLKLKRAGKKVIFDSHEDVPAQILDKTWIPAPLRRIVSALYARYESYVVRRLDALVVVVPTMIEEFQGRVKRVVQINNYPRLDDIQFHTKPFSEREPIICYAGGVNKLRGEHVMIEAMQDVDGALVIAGDRRDTEPGARWLGKLDRDGVNALYGSARAGIVVYQPAANSINSQPNKIFEFMAAGLPFVASNFPLWRRIIEGADCGICVDPTNPLAVREACQYLLSHPEDGQRMGRNGKNAVDKQYNWNVEAQKLISLYESIAGEL